jgi:extradiol dioxygenase family protein
MDRLIFHLSIPTADLNESAHFYEHVLGASIGRRTDDWLDVLLWGHQLTLQRTPSEVVPLSQQGKRHFGFVLPWSEWEQIAGRMKASGVRLLEDPRVLNAGAQDEQAKIYLEDPSHNVIELKAYRDIRSTLRLDDRGYDA